MKGIGKPNKVQTVSKKPTGSSKAGVNAYKGTNNKGKAWTSIKVSMKGRMK